MSVLFDDPAGVAPPIGSYSHLAVVPPSMETLYLAGQIGMTPDGNIPPDVTAQFEQALRNVVAILAAHGVRPSDIVRLNTYLVEPLSLEQARSARRLILGDVKPASTMLYVPRLATEAILVEVEATAVRTE